MGQVAHALLTRPPLSQRSFIPGGNPFQCFVRLACVKHAASVHPEPGSNSHVKVFPDLLTVSLLEKPVLKSGFGYFITCFRFLQYRLSACTVFAIFLNECSGLFCCSVFKVLLSFTNFPFLPTAVTFYHFMFHLSRTFFKFFTIAEF